MGGRIISFGSYKVEGGKVRGKLPPKVNANRQCMMYGLVGNLVREKSRDGVVTWKIIENGSLF